MAYAASKGALNTMTLSLSRAGAADPRQYRMPRLYRYALVHQGPRRTGAKAVRDAVVAKVALKVASSAERYRATRLLASPASSNMTGECVRDDAGMHLSL